MIPWRTHRAKQQSGPSPVTAQERPEPDSHSPSGVSFAPAHWVEMIDRSAMQAEAAGVILQNADRSTYDGRHVNVDGASLLNLVPCGYLGLELLGELRQGAIDAMHRYGTQFPFSRVYLACPLYAELESLLGRMTGGHVLADLLNTTLAHQSALPVLVEPGDAVIVDQFAHASLHTAIALLKGIHIEPIRHSRVDLLACASDSLQNAIGVCGTCSTGCIRCSATSRHTQRCWPRRGHPKLCLYIDDAHSTSWIGRDGQGSVLGAFGDRSRVVVVLSLNKAFSAAGAALGFADAAQRSRVQRCGGPMLFSPAGLTPPRPRCRGIGDASSLTDVAGLQRDLGERIDLVLALAEELDVPLVSRDRTPIFFVPYRSYRI